LLYLKATPQRLPPPAYDDVVDALADVVEQRRRRTVASVQRAGQVAIGVFAVVAAALLYLAGAEHGRRTAIAGGVLAIVLLAVAASVRWAGRRHRLGGLAAGAALPFAFVAGAQGVDHALVPTALGALVGLVAVSVAAVIAVLGVRAGTGPLLGAVVGAAAGALALLGEIAADAPAGEVAAVVVGVAFAGLAVLPTISLAAARIAPPLPMEFGNKARPEKASSTTLPAVSERTDHADQLLIGLLLACAGLLLVSAVFLTLSGSGWGVLLVLVVGLALLARTGAFGRREHRIVLVVAAFGCLVLAAIGLAGRHALGDWWLFLPALAGSVVGMLAAAADPTRRVSPVWGRLLDAVEALLIAAVIPVMFAVLGLYAALRSFAS
jgi:type VII secretion integral membrane protein EccD